MVLFLPLLLPAADLGVRRIGLVSLRALGLPSGLWQARPIRSQLCIGLNVWLSDPQTTPMLSWLLATRLHRNGFPGFQPAAAVWFSERRASWGAVLGTTEERVSRQS
jgi:hypothetical protein